MREKRGDEERIFFAERQTFVIEILLKLYIRGGKMALTGNLIIFSFLSINKIFQT
jgi:hypothetical protein